MPLVLTPNGTFVGTDNVGSDVIRQLAPTYDSGWARNWWSPPGTETESMLFALQAAVGGLLVGYAFGYFKGRKSVRPASVDAPDNESAHQ
ncbi:MAG: energy-coupling factor ABC transporter substrate-binding protein [Anaerolineales bacterium]|nr:energy-coupling factor ABC transporter substrate-binding protein [Anaerolineales bacterium]